MQQINSSLVNVHDGSAVLCVRCFRVCSNRGWLHGEGSVQTGCRYHSGTSNNKWSKTWSKFSVSFNFFMSFASSLSGSNLIV